MQKGTLQAINASAGTFSVFGQQLSFDAQRVKVFTGGKPATVAALKKGANIRFTLDGADLQGRRRVAVIYID